MNLRLVILTVASLLFFQNSAHAGLAKDRAAIPEVKMGYFLVAGEREFPAIQTYGLATCIGVGLYDKTQRLGAILHVSASTDIAAALDVALLEMNERGSVAPNITAQLVGGWAKSMGDWMGINYTSQEMVEELLLQLRARSVPVISNSTLLERAEAEKGHTAVVNMELDLRTGAFYPYLESIQSSLDLSHAMPVTEPHQ